MAAASATTKRMPVYFFSHGSPGLSLPNDMLDKSGKQAEWYRKFPELIGDQKPKALLVVSAHWEEKDGFYVNGVNAGAHDTIHDFYGFPRELYDQKFPAPTSPDLAARVIELAKAADIRVRGNEDRGLDHGCWSPLILAYPKHDIPVVQLSLHVQRGSKFDPAEHIAIGRALEPLRDEGYLIIASGGATHNLGNIYGEPKPYKKFADWLEASLKQTGEERDAAFGKWEKAPNASEAHPRAEHFAPMFVAVGAAGEQGKMSKEFDLWYHTFSLTQYRFD